MIGYLTIGTNDFDRALTFYDAVLAEMGAGRAFGSDRMQGYASKAGGAMLAICKPYNGESATAGNGTMISLAGTSHEHVDRVYAKAIAAGATDDGAPGIRTGTFYGAYFRDPDGNKICVYTM